MKKIMVVDDEDNMVALQRYNLEGDGYSVIGAGDGESALRLAAFDRPDLVILDCMMPGIDGFETCRRFKAEPRLHHIPIIMVTCRSGTLDTIAGLEAGAIDYITKPVDPTEIIARVKAQLREG